MSDIEQSGIEVLVLLGSLRAASVNRQLVEAAARGALVVTPEYNGGIPGVLKNAIDWLSRPWGHGALGDKPVAGSRVLDGLTLLLPIRALSGGHPRENSEVRAGLRAVVEELAAESGPNRQRVPKSARRAGNGLSAVRR